MNIETSHKCIEVTSDFYNRVAESFSKTRKEPWTGWKSAIEFCWLKTSLSSSIPIKVLDLGSGNFRFEKFLDQVGQEVEKATCIDNCDALANDKPNFCEFIKCDIFGGLPEFDEQFDMTASFGFFHHIPLYDQRASLLNWLVDNTKKGGIIVVSLWQFFNERLKEKSIDTTSIACEELGVEFDDENDTFLGWQDELHIYRYCHNFADEEIERLIREVSAKTRLLKRFLADGKNNNQNVYLILQKL